MSEKVDLYEGMALLAPKEKPEEPAEPSENISDKSELSIEFDRRMEIILPYLNLVENPHDIHDES